MLFWVSDPQNSKEEIEIIANSGISKDGYGLIENVLEVTKITLRQHNASAEISRFEIDRS